jgi:probable phosphoglycerate mutase
MSVVYAVRQAAQTTDLHKIESTAAKSKHMPTTFYVIRHGETDWNLHGRWQGHTDIPLNEDGRAQARRLAARLRADRTHFDAIYSSDLQRAWETAATVGAALDLTPRPLLALREIDVGSWGGLTVAEVLAQDGDTYARFRSGEDVPRGGGERFLDLYTRVVAAVEQLAEQQPGRTLALFTHGGAVRALLMHAARDKVGLNVRQGHIGNTSVSVLIGDRSGWDLGAINDMTHLSSSSQAMDIMSTPPDDAEQQSGRGYRAQGIGTKSPTLYPVPCTLYPKSVDDRYTIDTPENIEVAYDIAGIGSRFLAAMIDTLLIGIAQAIVFLIVGLTSAAIGVRAAGDLLAALGALLAFAILWGYYITFELLWSGQSPGKRAIGLRVVREGGRPINVVGSAIRNLIRIVDFLPALYGIGVLVMFVDRRSRRLGDLAAGTLVVKERRSVTLASLTAAGAVTPPALAPGEALPQPTLPNIQMLNDQDYHLVQEFLSRRSELGRDARARLGAQLAGGIQSRLGLPQGGDAERFLQFVVGEYQLLKRHQQAE